jgi:hypothetical protein
MTVKNADNLIIIYKIRRNDPSITHLVFDSVNMHDLVLLATAMKHNSHVVDLHFNLTDAPYPLSSLRELHLWKLTQEIDNVVKANNENNRSSITNAR